MSKKMEGDVIFDGGGRSSRPPTHARTKYDLASLEYDMTGDKLLYIFNQRDTTTTDFRQHDTEPDVNRIKRSFGNINFHVDEPCNNFTHDEIMEKLKQICEMDHSNTSCVAFAILTRGDREGQVYAADKKYSLRKTIDSLLLEPTLAGIPKLFFVQVCKKGNTDPGHQIQIDGHVRVTIPTHADFLVLMSTCDEHVRSSTGSLMIQALCDVLDKHHKDRDLLHMVTLIQNQVASRNTETTKETRFTLTKFLKL